jgi:archaetidylinositol phosphate synthase
MTTNHHCLEQGPFRSMKRAKKMGNTVGGTRAFHDAVRMQTSLTAAIERRALVWLAARMPAWIQPDHLTLLGFVAMFLAGASYAAARWNRTGLILAVLCLALNWFCDSMDGTLARLRNRQRPRYGFYVDHMIDSLGAFLLMSGLSFSGFISPRVAFGMLIVYLLLSIEVYLATYALGSFHLSFGKVGPTEIRILLAVANMTVWLHSSVRAFGLPYRLFDVGGVIGIAGMSAVLVVSAIGHTVKLYRLETFR